MSDVPTPNPAAEPDPPSGAHTPIEAAADERGDAQHEADAATG